MKYTSLAIDSAEKLVFGHATHPVKTRQGLVIGGGTVYPELNFTLPTMELIADTFPQVRQHYRQIAAEALKRAAALEAPGVVLEFETLPPMTERPEWAEELSKILLDEMSNARAATGLPSVLRITPNDTREMVRPPRMRSGKYWETMLETFNRCAAAGAELLSIESVGGKEVHDDALTMCNIRHVLFALTIMGARDMSFLWTHIVDIAGQHKVHAAGDTACGFANTAMVLAEQNMIPRVFAAVVRAISIVRSLVAYECGAVGPGKDCGYENPFLKAITGCPMSMEGKSAACAHFSPLGNIAAATCDLWSNESVQNIRLLAGMAPTCYLESLEYDCRLFNSALKEGKDSARMLQKWLVNSDALHDPQAYILGPSQIIDLANTIVSAPNHYLAGRAVALRTIQILREAVENEGLRVPEREMIYLDTMQADLESLPDEEEDFIVQCMAEVDTTKFIAADYGLKI
jgi:methanol---5-hydroxybenzimidazolylcobamide Co-methyltransferase